jgi:hypothetical protein
MNGLITANEKYIYYDESRSLIEVILPLAVTAEAAGSAKFSHMSGEDELVRSHPIEITHQPYRPFASSAESLRSSSSIVRSVCQILSNTGYHTTTWRRTMIQGSTEHSRELIHGADAFILQHFPYTLALHGN